jgi:hypothetical protein
MLVTTYQQTHVIISTPTHKGASSHHKQPVLLPPGAVVYRRGRRLTLATLLLLPVCSSLTALCLLLLLLVGRLGGNTCNKFKWQKSDAAMVVDDRYSYGSIGTTVLGVLTHCDCYVSSTEQNMVFSKRSLAFCRRYVHTYPVHVLVHKP